MKPWNLDGKRSARRMGIDSVRIVDAPLSPQLQLLFASGNEKKRWIF